jgi:UDP-N-acetylglucosamine 4,6-dehydratase
MFKDKVLMITGGTGSFGRAVLKRFLNTDISEIRIFSRDEEKQESLRLEMNNPKLKFYIGDVRDYSSIYQALKGVNYVFHAAALKQVPSCEFYPMEAYKTNVIGSENVMDASIARNVERVVLLSTDKAVYPINAMGISKAMMEKCMIAKSRNQNSKETVLSATRYGNVLASRGSVIPLFLSQIKLGKAITITDPNMTRFFMTLEESVNLVLFAFENGKQGDIFVQKSPAFAIGDLAIALKELLKKDTPINIIGTRHGEKLFESLISREEMTRVKDYENFYSISADNRDLNYAKFFSEGEKQITNAEDYTSHNTTRLDVIQIKTLLSKLDMLKDFINA